MTFLGFPQFLGDLPTTAGCPLDMHHNPSIPTHSVLRTVPKRKVSRQCVHWMYWHDFQKKVYWRQSSVEQKGHSIAIFNHQSSSQLVIFFWKEKTSRGGFTYESRIDIFLLYSNAYSSGYPPSLISLHVSMFSSIKLSVAKSLKNSIFD